jgi:hypothetical protein
MIGNAGLKMKTGFKKQWTRQKCRIREAHLSHSIILSSMCLNWIMDPGCKFLKTKEELNLESLAGGGKGVSFASFYTPGR